MRTSLHNYSLPWGVTMRLFPNYLGISCWIWTGQSFLPSPLLEFESLLKIQVAWSFNPTRQVVPTAQERASHVGRCHAFLIISCHSTNFLNAPRARTGESRTLVTHFYRAVHYSAKRGHVIACRLSVRLSVTLVDHDHIGWKSWKLIARTISPASLLFVAQRSSTYSQGNMEKFWVENVRS